ncbi:MAG: acetate--CoA ligase family protein [Cyanobacteria bacterium P01_H01_bin.150]
MLKPFISLLFPIPYSLFPSAIPNCSIVEQIIKNAQDAGRNILTESESKQILAAYGIPIVQTLVAKTEAEAVERANIIAYPLVLKLFSQTITHKTDKVLAPQLATSTNIPSCPLVQIDCGLSSMETPISEIYIIILKPIISCPLVSFV